MAHFISPLEFEGSDNIRLMSNPKWAIEYKLKCDNMVRPHSSLGYKPPIPAKLL